MESTYGVDPIGYIYLIDDESIEETRFKKSIYYFLKNEYIKLIKKNLDEFCKDINGTKINLNYKGKCILYYPNNKIKSIFYITENDSNKLYTSYFENGNIAFKREFIIDSSTILLKTKPSFDTLIMKTYFKENGNYDERLIYKKHLFFEFETFRRKGYITSNIEVDSICVGKYELWDTKNEIYKEIYFNKNETHLVKKEYCTSKIEKKKLEYEKFTNKESFNSKNVKILLICDFDNLNTSLLNITPILNLENSVSKIKPYVLQKIQTELNFYNSINNNFQSIDLNFKINSKGKIKQYSLLFEEDEFENDKIIEKLVKTIKFNPLLLKTETPELTFKLTLKVIIE